MGRPSTHGRLPRPWPPGPRAVCSCKNRGCVTDSQIETFGNKAADVLSMLSLFKAGDAQPVFYAMSLTSFQGRCHLCSFLCLTHLRTHLQRFPFGAG